MGIDQSFLFSTLDYILSKITPPDFRIILWDKVCLKLFLGSENHFCNSCVLWLCKPLVLHTSFSETI